MFIEPSKGQVLSFWIGASGNAPTQTNLVQYVHCIRVYESVCKSYITAQIIIYDNNNVIENMGIQPMDPAGFSFRSPPNNRIYGSDNGGTAGPFHVLKMKGEQVPSTLKYQIYYIDLIGPVFYKDKSQQVSQVWENATGTAAITGIWDQYLFGLPHDSLEIRTPSVGMYGKEAGSTVKEGDSPLTAIKKIMNEIVGAQYSQSGSWMLYRNRDNVILDQLENMMAPITANRTGRIQQITTALDAHGQQEYFLQKETWGAMPDGAGWGSAYNDPNIYHGIIVAQVEAREGSGSGGRSSGLDIAGAFNTRQFVFDLGKGLPIQQPLQALGLSGGGGLDSQVLSMASTFISQQAGAIAGSQVTNSAVFNNGTAPFTKTGEKSYSAIVKDSPQLVLKVPLQTGLNVTVGGGIWAQLTPPSGGINTAGYLLAGAWMVTDLVHEIFTDMRDSQATTSMQCVKGP